MKKKTSISRQININKSAFVTNYSLSWCINISSTKIKILASVSTCTKEGGNMRPNMPTREKCMKKCYKDLF